MKRTLLAVVLASVAAAPIWSQQVPTQFPQQPAQFPQQGQTAQQAPPPEQPDDNVADAAQHGVARLSLIRGSVSVKQAVSGEQSAAVSNAPLLKDDAVLTGDASYSEIQFDAVNMVRIAQNSDVRFGEVQPGNYALQVAAGTATYRMLRDSNALVEISLPQVSVRPLHGGVYRVSVLPDGQTEVRVLSGDAEVYSAHGSEKLTTAQMMLVRGTEDNPEYQIVAVPMPDEWDRWNDRRDQELTRSVSQRYVSPDIYGTEELDQNGTWANDPQYGNVWVPNQGADWAPYQNGRWDYENYYGWTWISYDPWGWAPYHYGRWFHGGRGWAWYPGGIGVHTYWRPALVGFFGWGGGVGVGFGYSHVGWVPLGPHEGYRPWYGVGRGGTIAANVNIAGTYSNARFASGITSVRSGDFGRVAISRNNLERPAGSDLARAGAIHGQMPFSPSRESYRLSDAQVNRQGMPQVSANQRFATRSNLARGTVSNGSFSNGSNGSGSFNGSNQGWRSMNNSGSSAGGQAAGRGWQRLDSGAAQQGQQQQGRSYSPATSSGYRSSYSSPQQTQRQVAPQQPVRISPPIVRDRGASGGGPDVHSGFGGAHPGAGGGGGASHSSGGGGGASHGGGGGHSGGGGHR